jgi:hypothetical protein
VNEQERDEQEQDEKAEGGWQYRRSGLFGKKDNQEGSIPVALTLQQLDTSLHSHPLTYCTAVKLIPTTAAIDRCETDFVVVSSNRDGDVEIAISECKTKDNISEEDVVNLLQNRHIFSGGNKSLQAGWHMVKWRNYFIVGA